MNKIEELVKLMKDHPEVLLVDTEMLAPNSQVKGKYLLVKDKETIFLIGGALPIEKHPELLYVFMKRFQYIDIYVYGGGLFDAQPRRFYEASTTFGEPPVEVMRRHLDSLDPGVVYTIEDAVPGDTSPLSKKITIEEVEKLLMP